MRKYLTFLLCCIIIILGFVLFMIPTPFENWNKNMINRMTSILDIFTAFKYTFKVHSPFGKSFLYIIWSFYWNWSIVTNIQWKINDLGVIIAFKFFSLPCQLLTWSHYNGLIKQSLKFRTKNYKMVADT